jgi:hypothetical protein
VTIEFVAQRLSVGDVVRVDLAGQGEIEAMVARPIDRSDTGVRVTLRADGREDFVHEWPLGAMVAVVRGP